MRLTQTASSWIPRSKCSLFITGHSHAFEHFRQGGKDFIVTGGGGGLLHPLGRGENMRWKDLFPWNSERRMFHYVLCEQYGNALRVMVKMIKPDFRTFATVYRFAIGK